MDVVIAVGGLPERPLRLTGIEFTFYSGQKLPQAMKLVALVGDIKYELPFKTETAIDGKITLKWHPPVLQGPARGSPSPNRVSAIPVPRRVLLIITLSQVHGYKANKVLENVTVNVADVYQTYDNSAVEEANDSIELEVYDKDSATLAEITLTFTPPGQESRKKLIAAVSLVQTVVRWNLRSGA